jgi:RNA polymerase-binding transcription factor DksA
LAAALALEEGMLVEIDAALERIREGTYGMCELTGKTIPDERLRALPWTRFTREAAEQLEKSRRR